MNKLLATINLLVLLVALIIMYDFVKRPIEIKFTTEGGEPSAVVGYAVDYHGINGS